jgi:ATP phosphoribosyltransferase
LGITGEDWLTETGANVQTLLRMEYGRVKMVIAIPQLWRDISSLSELLETFEKTGNTLRISTEYLNTTALYLKANPIYQEKYGDLDPVMVTPWWRKGSNSKVSIFLSFGATEAKPPENADAIVDIVETGTTLEQNDLKPIETMRTSEAVLIVNKKSLQDPKKKEKIYDVFTLLKGVIEGRKKFHIFVNVQKKNLDQLIQKIPALRGPTISPLATEGWYSVNTVIERKDFLALLPTIRKLAQGLVVYEPRQVLSLSEINGEENRS